MRILQRLGEEQAEVWEVWREAEMALKIQGPMGNSLAWA